MKPYLFDSEGNQLDIEWIGDDQRFVLSVDLVDKNITWYFVQKGDKPMAEYGTLTQQMTEAIFKAVGDILK